jgi:hypothetical protein
MLAWYRPDGDQYLTVWMQVSGFGWNRYSGSQFTMEFQRASEPRPGRGGPGRKRFWQLLAPELRERVRSIQNQVTRHA